MAQAASFEEPKGPAFKWWLFYGVVALLVLAAGWYLYRLLTDVPGVAVQEAPPTAIDMLPPPPPPPPPEPEEKPPEPVDQPTPAPVPTPSPAPEAPAPMQIDGPAQAGTDAFGLGAGKGGGMGAPGSAGTCVGPNCGGAAEGFYGRYLSGALQEKIQDNDKVNRQVFTADFAIWINPQGQVTKAELVRSSGDGKRDQLLLTILQNVRGLDAPPASLRFPQKITARGRRSF